MLEIGRATVQNRPRPESFGAHMTENVSAEQLRLFIERIETLEEE